MAASLGGVGYSPIAPGTAGSFVSLPLVWGASHLPALPSAILFIAMLCFSIVAAGKASVLWGKWDDQRIVIDETMGLWVACIGLQPSEFAWFGAAFLAFRLFDITKPWPASYFDRQVKSGVGVVMDDVAAGGWALLSLYAAKLLLTGSLLFR